VVQTCRQQSDMPRVSFSTFGLCLIPLSLAEHHRPREVKQSSSGSWVSDQMSHRTIVPEPLISLTSLHSSIVWWKGPPGIRTQHAPLFVSCLPCSSSRFSSDKLCACCLDFCFFEPLVENYGHCNTEVSGIKRWKRQMIFASLSKLAGNINSLRPRHRNVHVDRPVPCR